MAANPLPAYAGSHDAEQAFAARVHTTMESVRTLWLQCENSGICTAYQRYGWVSAIVEQLMPGMNGELLIVELSSATTGEPLMIVPLMRRRRLVYSEILWLGCGVCDYSAPLLVRPLALSKEEAESAWETICSVLPPADRIHIDGIPQQALNSLNPLSMLKIAQASDTMTSGMAISGPAETLIKRVCRPSFAKDQSKQYRRLERTGTVHFEKAKTDAQLDLIFGVLVEQRLSRFRELGRFDLLTQTAYVDFYLKEARKGLVDGSVRVMGLRVEDHWIATCYVLVHHDRVHGILLSIDQSRFNNVSPGLIIIAKAMEWAREQQLDYFDLSVGSLHYKESIGATSTVLLEINQQMTMRGRLATAFFRKAARLKTRIKANPKIYGKLRSGRVHLRRLSDGLRGIGRKDAW